MHVPDGFLDTKTFLSFWAVSAAVIGFAARKLGKNTDDKRVPMLGVLSAFVFATQMLNFPVAGGTSGHFMGGVLVSVLLGPLSGILIMSTVLIVQCLVFQDGGLTALGANIFNMGIIGAACGYYIYRFLNRFLGIIASVFAAGWLSILLASFACALQLAVSGVIPLKLSLAAMVSVHALIGLGEGLITVVVISFLAKIRPDLLKLEKI